MLIGQSPHLSWGYILIALLFPSFPDLFWLFSYFLTYLTVSGPVPLPSAAGETIEVKSFQEHSAPNAENVTSLCGWLPVAF